MVIVSAEEEVLGSVDVLVAELVVVVVPLLVVLLAFGDFLVGCHGFLGWSARRLSAARLFLLLPMLSKMRVKSVSYNYTIIPISLVDISLKVTKLS